MVSKLVLAFLWLGFLTYAAIFAPPNQPDTLNLIQQLVSGQIAGVNPAIVALFNILGVYPVIYSCLLLVDGRGQRWPAWIFAIGSFVAGAFALLPYLVLRQPGQPFQGQKNWLLRVLDSRLVGMSTAIMAYILVAYGLTQGNWADFAQQWQTSRFIHVMSLDFVCLSGVFPILLRDDMVRRGWGNRAGLFWSIALVPFLGGATYLAVRPNLVDPSTEVNGGQPIVE